MEPIGDSNFMNFLPGHGNRQDDSSCVARFYLQPVLHGVKSNAAGHEVYVDHEFVEIMVKGQPQQVYTGKVRPKDIERFPNAYAAFKANSPVPVVGTPIEQLPGVGPSQVLALKVLGIRTMEDMAQLSDEGLQKVGMGARELQAKCKAFISNSSTKNVELEAKLAERDKDVSDLKTQLAAMQAQMQELLSRKPAPLGLPKKNRDETRNHEPH